MKKYILFLLIILPLFADAQIIKTIILSSDTVNILNPSENNKIIRSIIQQPDTIQVYRLDDAQKTKLAKTKYSKDKKQNATFVKNILDSYSMLESALDNGNSKEGQEYLKMIDFRLGSDAPNIKELRYELNLYLTRAISKKERTHRKEYIENILHE